MAGLVPAIHVLLPAALENVDARDKPGHDGGGFDYPARLAAFSNFFITRSRLSFDR
ncbi:hypothetical protein IQ17_06312 [Bradyrhizobium daqingense]|uniref:Uncharacterized protein n=1 Tax=Bradyrhizobium daqingense TaxID=993502 RepID=A0A562KNH0_9BRAD|nr:hypothetical protein IQ17_06312 [Bradyrhizobium daqingense]